MQSQKVETLENYDMLQPKVFRGYQREWEDKKNVGNQLSKARNMEDLKKAIQEAKNKNSGQETKNTMPLGRYLKPPLPKREGEILTDKKLLMMTLEKSDVARMVMSDDKLDLQMTIARKKLRKFSQAAKMKKNNSV